MDIKHSIVQKIEEMGYMVSELTEKEKEYLTRIEEVITSVFDRNEAAKELMTSNHLSIISLSQKTNISRPTIYNNKILIEYIEYRKREFKSVDISNVNGELSEKVTLLSKQVENMRIRDAEIEELKIELKTLRSRLKDKEQELLRFYKPAKIISKN